MGLFKRPEEVKNEGLRYKVYLFKDDKSASYGPPMIHENRGMAIRFVQEHLPGKQAVWAKHPQDFTLFEIGEFDPQTGDVHMYESKNAIGLVQDFKSSLDS